MSGSSHGSGSQSGKSSRSGGGSSQGSGSSKKLAPFVPETPRQQLEPTDYRYKGLGDVGRRQRSTQRQVTGAGGTKTLVTPEGKKKVLLPYVPATPRQKITANSDYKYPGAGSRNSRSPKTSAQGSKRQSSNANRRVSASSGAGVTSSKSSSSRRRTAGDDGYADGGAADDGVWEDQIADGKRTLPPGTTIPVSEFVRQAGSYRSDMPSVRSGAAPYFEDDVVLDP